MSHRLEQIESTLRRAISQVLRRDMADPRIVGMVSITRLEVSADLRDAQVHISVMPARYERRTLQGLRHAAGHIHARLCKAVSMRTVPRLNFRLDVTLKKQAEVFDAIRRGLPDSDDSSPDAVGSDRPSLADPEESPT